MPRHPDTDTTPNTQLSEASLRTPSPRRPRLCLSRAEVADAVNAAMDKLYPGRNLAALYVDFRWIGKLERGEHRWSSEERRTALRQVFGAATDAELGLYGPRRSDTVLTAEGGAVRGGPPRQGSAEPAGLADERLSYALKHPGGVDLVTVARLRERVHDLDEKYDRAPSTSLLADAGQCLGQVSFLRPHAATSRVRRELLAVEAEAATLMGQLVWDASQRRDHATARTYFDQAVNAARQVRDPSAEALALLRTSFVALYGEKDPRTGLELALQTADTARAASHVLAGLALLHAAEAWAMIGQRRDCQQALSEADVHIDRIDAADSAGHLFSPTQHGRLTGSCYLFLQDAKHAEPILAETATVMRDRSKSQAIVLGNLALARVRQKKVDEALSALHSAIDVVETTWGGGGLNIVFAAGRELRPWRQMPTVQDVYDRLHSLMAAT